MIYKYVDIEGAKHILRNYTLKFTKPDDFNDPFEFHNELVKKEITIEHFEEIVRKRESDPALIKKHLENFEKDKLNVSENIGRLFEARKNSSLITCFSEKYDSVLMWSHYAQNHRGVCFGFSEKKTKKSFSFDSFLGKVKYKKKIKAKNLYELRDKAIEHWILTKSKDWAYEKEVRLVLGSASNKIQEFKSCGLRQLYLGCKISTNDKMDLLSIIQENNIHWLDIYESDISNSKFELIFNQMN